MQSKLNLDSNGGWFVMPTEGIQSEIVGIIGSRQLATGPVAYNGHQMPEGQLQTRCGHAQGVSYQHFSRSGSIAVKHRSAANLLTFHLDGELVSIADERGLPLVNEGDEVEVSGTIQGRAKGFGAVSLTNHTTGQFWQVSAVRAMGRGASSGCLGNALSALVVLPPCLAALIIAIT